MIMKKNIRIIVLKENKILDGGIQALYTMENENAPNEFIVNLELESGSSIGQNQETKEYYVQNNEGEVIALIGSPWATTKNGEFIKTHYEIQGDKIIQKIDNSNLTSVDYPITADPLFCSDTISDSSWKGGSLGTVSVYARGCAKAYLVATFVGPGALTAASSSNIVSDMWSEVKSDSDFYRNVSSRYHGRMWDQLVCHAINPVAVWKNPWNLDKNRPDVSLWSTYWAACNP